MRPVTPIQSNTIRSNIVFEAGKPDSDFALSVSCF